MRSIRLILLVLLLPFTKVNSQTLVGFQFYLGPSVPIGTFAAANSQKDYHGFAQTRLNWTTSLYLVSEEGLGLSLNFDYFSNRLDSAKIREVFNSDQFGVQYGSSDKPIWIRFGPSIGLSYFKYLNTEKNKSFRIEGKAGIMASWRPDTYTFGATNYGFRIQTRSYSSPLFALRSEIGFHPGKENFHLTLGVQYSYSRARLKGTYTGRQIGQEGSGNWGTYELNVNAHTLSFTLGIGLVSAREKAY